MMDQKAQSPARGIFWMVVTGLCFVAVTALVKLTGGRVPAAQSAFLRYVLGLVFVIPMYPVLRRALISTRLWRLLTLRSLFHAVGVGLWFYGMTRIPIAEVTAMNYLNPIYVTVLAALFLGEKLAVRRVLAIIVALLGAMLILRPGFRSLDPGHIAMLGTALAFAGSYLLAKVLADELAPAVLVGFLSLSVTVVLAPAAWLVWEPVSWADLALLFGVAGFATAGHYTMSMAFAAAPVTITQPVTFLQLVWSVAIGAVFFAEPVDPFVIAGGGIIIAAVVFITLREAALKRRITPTTPATKL